MARPTKYSEEIIEKTEKYLTEYKSLGYKIPSIASLAVYLNITRETVHDWMRNIPEFSYIIKILLSKQEADLLSNGLDGTYNSTITKLILSKHNYSDRVETDHRSSDGSMSPAHGEAVLEALQKKYDASPA